MAEFTGERVIPGLVEPDLWNEHLARYLFAKGICRGRTILDLGCGAGYGSHVLAETAATVWGLDPAPEAISLAQNHAPSNARFLLASALALPFADGFFDVVVAFEVIEHLEEWQGLLAEVKRVLAPSGTFIVSTPNKAYYAESRSLSGPNPFHHHEFEYQEFQSALIQTFSNTSVFTQNHTAGITIQADDAREGSALFDGQSDPGNAHFFVAVCGAAPPSLAYVPRSSNLLRERENHIQKLERELVQKTAWLADSQQNHARLVALHEEQLREMGMRAEFAREQDHRIKQSGERILQLQAELTALHNSAEQTINKLEQENDHKTQWALDTERRLTDEVTAARTQLSAYVDALHAVEETLEERTRWAQQLNAECETLEARLGAYDASRWIRLGRKLGVGPQPRG